jgi:hypothetical protein
MMPAGVKTWVQVDKVPTVKSVQELVGTAIQKQMQ